MSEFDDITAITQDGPGRWSAVIPEDWMQGRTAFGGLLAALAARAIRREIPRPRPLASLDVSFLAPVPAGPISIDAEVLKEGRFVTQGRAALDAGDGPAVCVHAVFAERRDSALAMTPAAPTPSKGPEGALEFPFIPGVTPAFTQHVRYLQTEGDPPFSGSSRALLGGYCRHRTAATGIEAVVALLDAWPAPVLCLGRAPFPASTVRCACHLVGEPPAGFDGDFFFLASGVSAGGGYATTLAHLWAGDLLVAWSEQLVAVFDG